MLNRLAAPAALILALAACQPQADTPNPIPPSDDCGASALQSLVGQPKTVLATIRLATQTRVIGPDEAVTADYSPDRLNIEYDDKGIIRKVSCY